MNDVVDAIKSNLNIVDIVGRDISLKKAGKDYMGLCPYHKDTNPSLMVSQSKQIFKCFACNQGGDIVSWYTKYKGLDFVEAVRRLSAEAGINYKSVGKSSQPSLKISPKLEQFVAENKALNVSFKTTGGGMVNISDVDVGLLNRLGLAENIKLKMIGYDDSQFDLVMKLWGICLAKDRWLKCDGLEVIDWLANLYATESLKDRAELIIEAIFNCSDAVVIDHYLSQFKSAIKDAGLIYKISKKIEYSKDIGDKFKKARRIKYN